MASKRGAGIMMASEYKPKSKVNLEGEHAQQVTEHPIGKKVKFTVHATKVSHKKNMDGTHSASYEVNKIEKLDNKEDDEDNEGKAEKAQNG